MLENYFLLLIIPSLLELYILHGIKKRGLLYKSYYLAVIIKHMLAYAIITYLVCIKLIGTVVFRRYWSGCMQYLASFKVHLYLSVSCPRSVPDKKFYMIKWEYLYLSVFVRFVYVLFKLMEYNLSSACIHMHGTDWISINGFLTINLPE